jgi:hypothetical protein
MKLKTSKIYTKRSGIKTKNQKIKDWSWNINNKDGQVILFRGGKRRKKDPQPTN